MTPHDGLLGDRPAEIDSARVAESPTAVRTNRTAIASLAASVLTVFGIGSIVGVVLGVFALNQIKLSGENGRGLAFAGILAGAVTLLLSMILVVMGLTSW